MTMWARVVDGLLDTLRALPGWDGPGQITSTTTVLVLDSTQYGDVERGWPAPVVVVADLGDGDEEPGDVDQAVATLAPPSRPRDETGTVRLRVETYSGDRDPRAARTDWATTLAAVEGALRTDPTVGLGPGAVHVVQVTAVRPRLLADDSGVRCTADVTLTYRARI